jgi:hypothetical protein
MIEPAQMVNLVPTITTLSTAESTVPPGQLVTVTAVVSPAQGGGTPTGRVQFTSLGNIPVIDPISLPLMVVGGQAEAMFLVAMLDAGTHTINASYSGDSEFAPSTAALTVTVTGTSMPTPPGPPTVAALGRTHAGLTSITVGFGVALDPGSATDVARYLVRGAVPDRPAGGGVFRARLGIKSVGYNAAAETVTITLARPHKGPVQVTVRAGLLAADGAATTSDFVVAVR